MFCKLSVLTLAVTLALVSCEFESAQKVEVNIIDTAPNEETQAYAHIRVTEKPFKGPEHMKFFGDFCMRESPSGGGGAYSYTVCPYHNVTQLDTRVGDSTDVVVGTWHGWIIENNTYKGWHFYAGDPCEGKSREAKVMFECGQQNELVSVSEKEKCEYVFQMHSPMFCNNDSLLVYPFLCETMQHKWDVYETQRSRGLISKHVYNELLDMMFAEEGLVLTDEDRLKYHEEIIKEEPQKFDSLDSCEREFHLVKRENALLKAMTSKEALTDLETQMAEIRQQENEKEQRAMEQGGRHDAL
ncbi:N-acetylglucosamine-1-phosphotransferase subunit gamma-like isoform X2 [Convolutriloba macropyga]|uniref:N-acetylglucosamine-1-phosphotransferase subunit gamma-like isoform X2 n=1 Tax=Convolutriloba macropyga TaxID=536237 RepID=UPI003F524CF3